MRKLLLTILGIILLENGFAQTGPSFQSTVPQLPQMIPQSVWLENERTKDTKALDTGVVQDVYIAVGYVVYLSFPKDTPIENVYVGSIDMITADVSPEQNAIALNAHVLQGKTNMTVILKGKPYSFSIHIVTSGEIKYTLAYSLQNAENLVDERTPVFGPALAPDSIEIQKYIQAIENRHNRYKTRTQLNMQQYKVNKLYNWANTSILLDSAYCFAEDNMLVLRVVRKNLGATVSYLSAQQLGVSIANHKFPTTLAMQMNEVLFPGQSEYIYLFLQGFNLVAKNNFELTLPPSSDNLVFSK